MKSLRTPFLKENIWWLLDVYNKWGSAMSVIDISKNLLWLLHTVRLASKGLKQKKKNLKNTKNTEERKCCTKIARTIANIVLHQKNCRIWRNFQRKHPWWMLFFINRSSHWQMFYKKRCSFLPGLQVWTLVDLFWTKSIFFQESVLFPGHSTRDLNRSIVPKIQVF